MRHAKMSMVVAVVTAAGLGNMTAVRGQPDAAPPPGANGGDTENGQAFEALARGPLHEAFASPYVREPKPAEVIPQAPPDPITEQPAEQVPEGDDIAWIPGYWSWDPAAESYLWVSGLWRHVPPGRRWVPGYWTQASSGYQWVPGFWVNATSQDLVYLPAPPALRSSGPAQAAPNQDTFWVPGNWSWNGNDYVWRDGYWTPIVPGWVWIPAQYVWTPHGCIFVAGYWDRTFDHRGVLFAPVVYHQPIYNQPNYSYQPNVVLRTVPLLMHMFASPGYNHYFYGDYYGYNPRGVRFFPWYTYNQGYNQYNPLLIYYQWAYARRNVNLVNRLASWNNYFVAHKRYRPQVTFRAQRRFVSAINANQLPIPVSSILLADSLNNFTGSNFSELMFTPTGQNRLEAIRNSSQSLRNFQQQRRQFEQVALQGNANGKARQPGNQTRSQPAEASLKLPDVGRRTPAEKGTVDQANRQAPDNTPGNQQGDQPPSDEQQTGDRRQPGAPNQGPPDQPKPIERGDQTDQGDQSQRSDKRNQPGQPGTPNSQERPNGPGGNDQSEEPSVRSDENLQGASEPEQQRRFPRFGVGPREQNEQAENRSGVQQPNSPSPNPDAEQPNRPDVGEPRSPRGRGPAALNLLPPGAEPGGTPGAKRAPGRRPEPPGRAVPETRPPETDRPDKPETQRPTPDPGSPGGRTPNPQPRPKPKPDPPKAANQGGESGGPPAAQRDDRREKSNRERRKENEKK